jgi:hypothetical protein
MSRVDRRFGVALVASALLHFVLVAAPGWRLPGEDETRSVPIEARLLPPPKIAAGAAEAAPSPKPAPKPAPKPRPRPAPKPRPPPPELPQAQQQETVAPEPPSEPPAQAFAEGQASAASGLGEAPPLAAQSEEPPGGETQSRPAPGPATENVFPYHGRVVFSAARGADGFVVGTAETVWLTQGDRYQFRLYLQTTGLVALFKRVTLSYSSDGRITANGFVPHSYKLDENGELKEAVVFDWERRRLTIASPRGHAAFDLMEASQDLVSVIYQMALFPPSESPADVWVATGRAYTNRYLQVVGTEQVTTRLGSLRALHVRLGREGDELLDLWFGVDVKHLPVRIRWARKDGSINDFQAAYIEYDMGKEKVKLVPPPEPPAPLG